jgi:SAM-dependent methyltransferase
MQAARMDERARFSELGKRYGEELARGLHVTGESGVYYATRRIDRVRELAAKHRVDVRSVLDFGCGIGIAFPLLRAAFPDARVLGFEPADGLREVAADAAVATGAEIVGGTTLDLERVVDVVYCNGVFHHIPSAERIAAIATLARALRSGGWAFIWENSPLNPGTRYVMSRISFDKGAILVGPRELQVLEISAGITPLATEFHFIFPHALKVLRPLEARLRHLPLGGQFLVAGRRD